MQDEFHPGKIHLKPEFYLNLPANIFCQNPIRENQMDEFNLKQGE